MEIKTTPLSNNFPQYIEINGKEHKINTDFRVALKCFEVMEDENIDDIERTLTIHWLLFGDIFQCDWEEVNEKISRYLSCGQEVKQEENEKRDMDLLEDRKYINSSFMSDYRIDLNNIEYLHWYQFMELLGGLTENCILSHVRDIRTRSLKGLKGKARQDLENAKRKVALKPKKQRMTKEEEDAWNKFEAQLK